MAALSLIDRQRKNNRDSMLFKLHLAIRAIKNDKFEINVSTQSMI